MTDNIHRALHDRGICVVIPTYNNVGTIGSVVADALGYCDDVIVVDDGSDDGTTGILRSVSGISLISYRRNRGKGYALKQAFTYALRHGFAYAITMDADGQHFAKDIPAFLEANMRWPGSIILGNRKMENVVMTKGSRFANRFSNFWFTVETGRRVDDTQTGFRLYPLKKMYGYRLVTSRYEAELELLTFASWHGVQIHSIPVDVYYPPREQRVSHFRPGRDFARISIMNTVFCVLALIYGLPLFLLRKAEQILRSAFTFSVAILFMLLIVSPLVWLNVHVGRLTDKRRWRLHKLMYRVLRWVAFSIGVPGTRFSCRMDKGADFTTPSVIICNHQSTLDLVYLLALSPKIVVLTNDRVWHNPLYGYLIRHTEFYPASSGIDNLLPRFRSLAGEGYSIAIFPEGTRSVDGRIGEFHSGAFYVAGKLGLDITPVFLYGTGKVLRKKSWLMRRGPVYMEVCRRCKNEELSGIGLLGKQTRHFYDFYLRHYGEISNKTEQDV